MTKYLLICLVVCALIFQGCWHHESAVERGYNEKYIGEYTRKIAFPIGGIGTGIPHEPPSPRLELGAPNFFHSGTGPSRMRVPYS